MKHFLTGILTFAITATIQLAGVACTTWQFWVVIALILALICVQYLDR